jgi:GxxExxY protein
MKTATKEELNRVSDAIIGAAIAVHQELGAGLLESAYEACLEFELLERGFREERQKELPLMYKGVHVDCGYRIDLLVDELVIVEVKSVEKLAPIHEAQLLSYMKLTGCHLGLVLNFNVRVLKDGLKRLVRDFPD